MELRRRPGRHVAKQDTVAHYQTDPKAEAIAVARAFRHGVGVEMHRSCVGVALEEDVNAHCGIVLHCEIAEVAAIEENRGSPRGIRG